MDLHVHLLIKVCSVGLCVWLLAPGSLLLEPFLVPNLLMHHMYGPSISVPRAPGPQGLYTDADMATVWWQLILYEGQAQVCLKNVIVLFKKKIYI